MSIPLRPWAADELKALLTTLQEERRIPMTAAVILSACVDAYLRPTEEEADAAENILAEAYACLDDFMVTEQSQNSEEVEAEFALSIGTALAADAERRLSEADAEEEDEEPALPGPQSLECIT